MSKITAMRNNLSEFIRTEGNKYNATQAEVNRLLLSLDYVRLYHALMSEAEPVYIFRATGNDRLIQYHSEKLFPSNAILLWDNEGHPFEDEEMSSSYFTEIWLLEDMTIATVSCYRLSNYVADFEVEYRVYKGNTWPSHLRPVELVSMWEVLHSKYSCDDGADDSGIVIYEP